MVLHVNKAEPSENQPQVPSSERVVAEENTEFVGQAPEDGAGRSLTLQNVAEDWTSLRGASALQRSNKDFMLGSVSICGMALEYASDELKRDKDVVQSAIRQDPRAIRFAGSESRKFERHAHPLQIRESEGGCVFHMVAGCFLESDVWKCGSCLKTAFDGFQCRERCKFKLCWKCWSTEPHVVLQECTQLPFMGDAAEIILQELDGAAAEALKKETRLRQEVAQKQKESGDGHPLTKVAWWKLSEHLRSVNKLVEAEECINIATHGDVLTFNGLSDARSEIEMKRSHIRECFRAAERIRQLHEKLRNSVGCEMPNLRQGAVDPITHEQSGPIQTSDCSVLGFLACFGIDEDELNELSLHGFDAKRTMVLGFTWAHLEECGFKVRSRDPPPPEQPESPFTIFTATQDFRRGVDRMPGSDRLPCMKEMLERDRTLGISHHCWGAVFNLALTQARFRVQINDVHVAKCFESGVLSAKMVKDLGFDVFQLQCIGFTNDALSSAGFLVENEAEARTEEDTGHNDDGSSKPASSAAGSEDVAEGEQHVNDREQGESEIVDTIPACVDLSCSPQWTGMLYLKAMWIGLNNFVTTKFEDNFLVHQHLRISAPWDGLGSISADFRADFVRIQDAVKALDEESILDEFWNDITHDDRVIVVAFDGITKAVGIMQSQRSDVDIQLAACSLLRNLTDITSLPEIGADHSAFHDGVPLEYHQFNMSVDIANGVIVAGAVNLVLDAMLAHKDLCLQEEGCRLLGNLARIRTFPLEPGFSAVTKAMSMSKESFLIQEAGLQALSVMVQTHVNRMTCVSGGWRVKHLRHTIRSRPKSELRALRKWRKALTDHVLGAMVKHPRRDGVKRLGKEVLEGLKLLPNVAEAPVMTYSDAPKELPGKTVLLVTGESIPASMLRHNPMQKIQSTSASLEPSLTLGQDVEVGLGDATQKGDQKRQMFYEQQQRAFGLLVASFLAQDRPRDAFVFAAFSKARALAHMLKAPAELGTNWPSALSSTLDGPKEVSARDQAAKQVFTELTASVTAEKCTTIEFFCLSDDRTAVWVIDSNGRLLCSKVLASAESTTPELPVLMDLCRVGMGVRDRNQLSRDLCQLHEETSEMVADLKRRGEEQDFVTDLYVHYKQGTLAQEDFGDMASAVDSALDGMLKDPVAVAQGEAALAQYRGVQRWLKALAAEDASTAFRSMLEQVQRKARSWQYLKQLTDSVLQFLCDASEAERTRFLGMIAELFDEDRVLRMLHARLIEPIEQFILTESELLIIPHRNLFNIPWAALLGHDGTRLIQRFAIRIAPSLKILGAQQPSLNEAVAQSTACSPSRCVVVGNPWPNSCGPLPLAQQEAENVGVRLLQRLPGMVDIMTEGKATRSKLLPLLDGARWVHFACHALLDEKALVLARETDKESELLSMDTVQQEIKLGAGATVLLSACNSGRGEITGEGVVGLSRAFMVAGASCAVVSLWSVGDSSTKALMVHLYAYMEQGMAVHQAMRFAMLKMAGLSAVQSATDDAASEEPADVEQGASDSRSFDNAQGKAELKALQHLFNNGKEFVFAGSKLAVGNGVDSQGRIEVSACEVLFGVSRFLQVWGGSGAAVRRAQSARCDVDALKLAIKFVQESVKIRENLQKRLGPDPGHAFMIERLQEALQRLGDALAFKQVSRIDEALGALQLQDSSAAFRGNCGTTLQHAGPATLARPIHWAGFLVVGNKSHLPEPASTQGAAAEKTATLLVSDVCELLHEMGLGQYAPSFEENSIDGTMLDDLEELWSELGVEKKAHQIKIRKWLSNPQALRPHHQDKAQSPDPVVQPPSLPPATPQGESELLEGDDAGSSHRPVDQDDAETARTALVHHQYHPAGASCPTQLGDHKYRDWEYDSDDGRSRMHKEDPHWFQSDTLLFGAGDAVRQRRIEWLKAFERDWTSVIMF